MISFIFRPQSVSHSHKQHDWLFLNAKAREKLSSQICGGVFHGYFWACTFVVATFVALTKVTFYEFPLWNPNIKVYMEIVGFL